MAKIQDVAAYAGVTVTTVSRVLNNRGPISEKTRNKVREAMEALNYYPNQNARNLFFNKTNLIALIVSDSSHSFFASVVKHMEIATNALGYKLLLCNTIEKDDRVRDYLTILQQNKVDGIIICSHHLDIEKYVSINLPIVGFDQNLGPAIPVISSDHAMGGRLAARELIANGCRCIAQIQGYSKVKTPSNTRYVSFQRTLSRHGVKCRTYEIGWNKFSFHDYRDVVSRMFEEMPDLDGVFAVDNIAAEVIKQAHARGRRIPNDLKIVGYDGTEIAAMLTPSLTTIRQPIKELCGKTLEVLVGIIEGKKQEGAIKPLGVRIIKGETTFLTV